jgi:hypothetical protein
MRAASWGFVAKPTVSGIPAAWQRARSWVQERLVAVGCSAYASGPGPQWTEADRKSYAKWQRKLGCTSAAADGWPGAKSWAALKVPYSS